MPARDVIVVGAGLSGLHCASILASAGLSVEVLEARDRVGGRALSRAGVDLGGSWHWPGDQRCEALARALNVSSVPQRLDGDAFAVRAGKSSSLGDAGASIAPCGPGAGRWLGGYGAVAARLAASLTVRTGSPVSAVVDGGGGDEEQDGEAAAAAVRVTVGGGAGETFSASRVVIAVPPAVWARDVAFTPALAARRRAHAARTSTWCGDWLKLAAVFATPFWRERGSSGVVAAEGAAQVWWEAGAGAALGEESAALVGLGVGAGTAALAAADDGALREAVVDALGPVFGRAKVRDELRAVHCKAWAADALTFDAKGSHREYGHAALRAPHGRVHFAGTESEALHGHVEGALAAGERAAREILDALRPR